MMVILGFIASVLGLVAYFVLKVALASATTALNAAQAGVRTTQRGAKVVGKRLFNGKSAKVADSAVDVSAKFANMSINALKMLVRMLKWLLALIKSVVGLFTGLSFTVGLVVALVLIVVIASTYTVVMMVVTKDLASGGSTMSDYSSMAAQASDEGTWGENANSPWGMPFKLGDSRDFGEGGRKAEAYGKQSESGKHTYASDGSDVYVSCGYRGYAGHTGADITCSGSWGRPLYSVTDCTITSVTDKGCASYGLHIRCKTADGKYEIIYAHCSSTFVEEGQKVSKGTKIATLGCTGNSSGPHLHFEVREGDKGSVEPLQFLPDTFGSKNWK